MAGYCTLDFETNTPYDIVKDKKGNEKKIEAIHGPTFRDPNNDIYTIIYGSSPNNIKVLHSNKGFKRKIPFRVGQVLRKSHTLITQNGKFDLCYVWNDKYIQEWLRKEDRQLWDIQLVRYLLSAQRHTYPSLAELQRLYLNKKIKPSGISALFSKFIGANEIIKRRHERKRWWRLYNHYCYTDGSTPMEIMKIQYSLAKKRGMLPIIKLYNDYLLSLCMTEQNGIDLDLQQLEVNEKILALEELDYLKQAETIAKKYWFNTNLPTLNINSPDHKSVLLFGGYIPCKVRVGKGVLIKSGPNKGKEQSKLETQLIYVEGFKLNTSLSTSTAKEGFYSTGAPIIEKIYAKSTNEEAKTFCKYMKLANHTQKMLNTYIRSFRKRSVKGKLYPNFNNTETITSRLSSSKPNFQNIPATGRYNELIQGLMIAPPGFTCISIDYNQLEVFVQAMLSNDSNLIYDLQTGKCLHCQNLAWMSKSMKWTDTDITYEQAVEWAKTKKIDPWPERRGKAKPITFGKAYGKMEESATRDTGIPLPIMKQIYKEIDKKYPEIVTYCNAVKDEVYSNSRISKKTDYADKYTKGTKSGNKVARRFYGKAELLPIKLCKGSDKYFFRKEELRHVGYYTSPTGKRYAFEEFATKTKNDDIFRYFKPTQMKNYMVQGTASDVQASTTVAMFKYLLDNSDIVKMVNEIHDSKWFIVKTDQLDCIVNKLCVIMQSVKGIFKDRFNINTVLDFPVEVKVGTNFSNMEVYKHNIQQ